jgi:carboxypeptidase PM20D1
LPAAPDGKQAADHLVDALRIRTLTGRDGAPLDPAAFSRLTAWLAQTYPRFHAAATREEIGGSLLYTWKGDNSALPPILISAPLDTEKFNGGGVKNDVVFGQGALGARGALIAMFEAADALAASGYKPKRTILFALGQDDAAPSAKGAGKLVAELQKRGVKPWFALGPGQLMPAAYPLTGKPVALIGVAEQQELVLRVVAKADPVRGGEAVTVLARALITLESVPTPGGVADEPARSTMRALGPVLPGGEAFMVANAPLFGPVLKLQLRDSPFGQDAMTSTLHPVGLAGGEQNGRAEVAAAFVRVRLHPFDTPDVFLKRVRDVLAAHTTVSVNWQTPAAAPFDISAINSPAYNLIASAASGAANGAPPAPTLYPGATALPRYAAVTKNLYTLTPALVTDDEALAANTPGERLSFANLARMIQFYVLLFAHAEG